MEIIARLEQKANWKLDQAIYWSVYGLTEILEYKYSEES